MDAENLYLSRIPFARCILLPLNVAKKQVFSPKKYINYQSVVQIQIIFKIPKICCTGPKCSPCIQLNLQEYWIYGNILLAKLFLKNKYDAFVAPMSKAEGADSNKRSPNLQVWNESICWHLTWRCFLRIVHFHSSNRLLKIWPKLWPAGDSRREIILLRLQPGVPCENVEDMQSEQLNWILSKSAIFEIN
jgi:hypothetical protein